MELPADLNGCSAAIPAALEEMMTSHNNIGQISQYCKSAYQQVRALPSRDLADHRIERRRYSRAVRADEAVHERRSVERGLPRSSGVAAAHQLPASPVSRAGEGRSADQNYHRCMQAPSVMVYVRSHIVQRLKAIHDQAGSLSLRFVPFSILCLCSWWVM